MARPALASRELLEEAVGEIDDAEGPRADSLLARASAIVRAEARRTWLNDAGDALQDVPDDIPGIVVGMVERAIQNPSGTTQETAGPFARSFGSDAAQRLYLTGPEKKVVRWAAGRTGIGVLQTTRGPLETPAVRDYWENFNDDDCGLSWPS